MWKFYQSAATLILSFRISIILSNGYLPFALMFKLHLKAGEPILWVFIKLGLCYFAVAIKSISNITT